MKIILNMTSIMNFKKIKDTNEFGCRITAKILGASFKIEINHDLK
jgi:hypothetical protein